MEIRVATYRCGDGENKRLDPAVAALAGANNKNLGAQKVPALVLVIICGSNRDSAKADQLRNLSNALKTVGTVTQQQSAAARRRRLCLDGWAESTRWKEAFNSC